MSGLGDIKVQKSRAESSGTVFEAEPFPFALGLVRLGALVGFGVSRLHLKVERTSLVKAGGSGHLGVTHVSLRAAVLLSPATKFSVKEVLAPGN